MLFFPLKASIRSVVSLFSSGYYPARVLPPTGPLEENGTGIAIAAILIFLGTPPSFQDMLIEEGILNLVEQCLIIFILELFLL